MEGFVRKYGLETLLKFPDWADTLSNHEIAQRLTAAKYGVVHQMPPDEPDISDSYVSQLKRRFLRHGFKDNVLQQIDLFLGLQQSELDRLQQRRNTAQIIPIAQVLGRSPK